MTEICQGVPTTWNLYTQTLLFPQITDWRSQFVSTKLIAFYRFGRYFITTLHHKVPTQNWVNWLSASHEIYTLKPCYFPKSLIGAQFYFITALRHKVPTQNWVNWLSASHEIYTLKPCYFPKSLIGAHSFISSPHFATRCHPSSRVNWPECESAAH